MQKLQFALIIITWFLTYSGLFAQTTIDQVFPVKDGKIIYTEVVQADSLSSSVLYKNAKQWLVSSFKSSKEVIQAEDEAEHYIIGKVWFEKGHTQVFATPKTGLASRLNAKTGDIVTKFMT